MSESGAFFDDGIGPNLDRLGVGASERAVDAMLDIAPEVLEAAQYNAPWSDRTGTARAGLEVDVYEEGDSIWLELYHTVDYGLWLEVIQNGRFATIMPTLEAYASEIFAAAGATFTDEESGDF